MNISRKFRSFGRQTKLAVSVLLTGLIVATPLVTNAEFYPDRPTFDYNKTTGGDCNDPSNPARDGGRCGSMNGPVFNSFINTPSYGDERAFFDGRRSDKPANTNADDIKDVTEGSQEVILRTYVHNNANTATNASGLGVAHNAKVRVLLPTASDQVLRARSYISADNAALVEDTVDLIGNKKFHVQYVPGSAKLLRNNTPYALSDSIVTTGAQIGDKVMNGELPGCFEYAALVEIHVKIVAETPNMSLTKQVRKHVDGQKGNWTKEVNAKPGEKVDWLLNTKNIGSAALTDVVTRDVLPPHVKLVPGSISFVNAKGTQTLQDGPLFSGGYNAGLYNSNENTLITFTTTVQDDFSECSTRVRNVAHAKSKEYPTEITDDADVVITKENCKPTTPPTTTTPSSLPNTGPGAVVAIFAAVSAAGSIGYYVVTTRFGRSY